MNFHRMRSSALLLTTFWLAAATGYAQQAQLSTSTATLSLERGTLSIRPKGSAGFTVTTPVPRLWKLVLQNTTESTPLTPVLVDAEPASEGVVQQANGEITLTYATLRARGQEVPVRAVFRIGTKDDAFHFSGTLTSSSEEWQFRELHYPLLTGIQAKGTPTKVYWPVGLGQCFDDPAAIGRQILDYPSGRGTMQWLTINTPNGGFYVGCHDPARSKKVLEVAYDRASAAFSTGLQFPVFSREFTVPDVLVAPYAGTWHTAAKRYRAWYESQFKLPTLPAWVKADAGWLLAILKQQNGYVMWRYDELDQLCDIADRFGFKTLGLFGWAHGGHDRLFPTWVPDDLLGGQTALKAAIQRAHQRGFKIILYANATMMDATSEYYRYAGNETMAVREDRSAYTSSIRKYNGATPVVFVESSYSSRRWRETMMNLATQAYDLGADGILYDQAGVKGALLNFSKLQDHTLPQESGTKYRVQMLNDIRTAMKKRNPEFIVMTEATNDGVIDNIDYHHGWGIGAAIDPIGFGTNLHTFPALYRYTFPELVKTQRNANPMIPRAEANFAAVYGLRHEIETRYAEDVAYLTKGTLPTAESYADVTYYPPVPAKIRVVPADVATKYVHDLIQFENESAAFLRLGTFVDEEGIQVAGEDLTAKGFRSGNQTGVVVWNTHPSAARPVRVAVPGYRLVEAKEPGTGKTAGDAPLSANSIRLLIFQKND